jgi:Holliday junction resolvase RusA-like endonuclease
MSPSQIIKFTIPGNPVAKARARTFTTKRNIVRSVTPTKTRKWEEHIATIAQHVAIQNKLKEPFAGPIILGCIFYRSIPKSFSKKKRKEIEENTLMPTTKPDLSNYFKCIEDGCEGILWKNDSQIIAYGTVDKLHSCKRYSDEPHVKVEVQFLP